MKRLISITLTGLLILALVGCSGTQRDVIQLTFSTEDTEAILATAGIYLPDPDEDRYALDDWYYSSALMNSCGETIIVYNTETQQYENNVDAPAIERAANLLYDLSKNNCVYPVWSNGWVIRNATNSAGIKEGLQLFCIGGTWMFTGPVDTISAVWGDVSENELMFVPLSRDDSGDGRYYTNATSCGYCIVQGATNPEGVVLLAACMRFKVLDPTVVNIDKLQLENTYLWTTEMLDMWDTCYKLATSNDNVLVTYGEGLGSKLSSVVGTYEGLAVSSEPTTWAQLKQTYDEQLEYYIKELNTSIEQYDPNAE